MAMSDLEGPAYSISLRLRRTTTEDTFVSIPVTADLIVKQPDGTGRIDVAKMTQRGIEIGQAPDVVWSREGQTVGPHPIQTAPPGLEQR